MTPSPKAAFFSCILPPHFPSITPGFQATVRNLLQGDNGSPGPPHSAQEKRASTCRVINGLSPAGDRGMDAPHQLQEGSSLSCSGEMEQRSASSFPASLSLGSSMVMQEPRLPARCPPCCSSEHPSQLAFGLQLCPEGYHQQSPAACPAASGVICRRISPPSASTSCTPRSSTSGTCSDTSPPPPRCRCCSHGHSTASCSCRCPWRSCCTACQEKDEQAELKEHPCLPLVVVLTTATCPGLAAGSNMGHGAACRQVGGSSALLCQCLSSCGWG